MSQPFVGTLMVDSVNSLRSILQTFATADCIYFARWPHQVSGMVKEIDKVLPSPDGQLLGTTFEVRWKQNRRKEYDVLLLHCNQRNELSSQPIHDLGFEPVGENWRVAEAMGAYLYDADETRFPKGFNFPKDLKLQQRYFQNTSTATVHFVALMVKV